MDTKIQIQQVKKILYGGSLILFPIMLLLGFLMHPDLLSFAMTTTAQQLAANFRHSAMFHIGHLIVTLAVPLIIAAHLSITERLQDKGIWYGFIYMKDSEIGKVESYDVVCDCVGKAKSSPLKEACKKALTTEGKYLSIDDAALLLDSRRLDRIRKLIELGQIKPINDRCYAPEQMVEAHQYVELGHKTGNVEITVSQST
ncbi:MAG: hypothetical protein U0175_37975 [Caldilineaceae bacterium]